jgi:hypothetical protein
MIYFNKGWEWLEYKQFGVTSQHGEDGIIEALFEKYPPQNKYCVEIGAWDGNVLSNTWNLINNKGWRSLQIEYDPNPYAALEERYKNNDRVQTMLHKVTRTDLDSILKSHKVPQNFDLMSLDIDSYDYEVWKNMTYEPNIVLIEINGVEEDINLVDYDPTYSVNENHNYGGVTVAKLNPLAEEKGYEFICAIKCNAFYIKKEFMNENQN